MAQYFEKLATDLATLDLSSPPLPLDTYIGVYSLLVSMGKDLAFPPSSEQMVPQSTELKTTFGKRIAQVLSDRLVFTDSRYPCCSQSEVKLLQNLTPAAAEQSKYLPVILTDQDQPLAIWKNKGDPTCYGLVDDFERGIVAGAFSSPSPRVGFDPKLLGLSQHAWQMDIDAIDDINLIPTRFSFFALPVADRQTLHDICEDEAVVTARQKVIPTSHANIVRQAEKLLASAMPLPELRG